MRRARLFDGVADTGQPYFASDRARIADDAELHRVSRYLRGGAPVMLLTGHLDDVVEPARGQVVPLSYRTDGTWIWSAALGYYADTHRIAPEPDFVEHMRRNDFVAPRPDLETCCAAAAQIKARWKSAARS